MPITGSDLLTVANIFIALWCAASFSREAARGQSLPSAVAWLIAGLVNTLGAFLGMISLLERLLTQILAK